jgi:hypothetical protein
MNTPFVPRKLYSVFSTDMQDMKYASLAPLSAYVWKHHLGVTPIVYISFDFSQLSHVGQLLVDAIEMYGGEVRIVPRRPGDSIPTTLQNVRLAAFQSRMLRPDDYLITADADIWPLSKDFWRTVLTNKKDRMFIYNGPFYHHQRALGSHDFAALSFLGAPVRYWRTMYSEWVKITGANNTSGVHQTLWQILDAGKRFYNERSWNEHPSEGEIGVQWSWDQVMAGQWLQSTKQCPDHCYINEDVRRLDRMNWQWSNENGSQEHDTERILQFTDAHLPFPLSDESTYQKLRSAWMALFSSAEVIDSFRESLAKANLADKNQATWS